MDDVKPRFFISHDEGGLFFWLARKRPVINPASGRYESADAARMRLPYTWFGHMMRENTIHAVDVVSAVDGLEFR